MFVTPHAFDKRFISEFKRLESQMDRLFGVDSCLNSPATVEKADVLPINIGASESQVDIYLFVAGVDTKSLDLSIHNNKLTIAGERKLDLEDSANYFRKERFQGQFKRVVQLPDDVDSEAVDASYKDGVLHVAIKRHGAVEPRKIEIK